MAEIEQVELASHRTQLMGDVSSLVQKYRAIFDWDSLKLFKTKRADAPSRQFARYRRMLKGNCSAEAVWRQAE
jgi:hypothetical protein